LRTYYAREWMKYVIVFLFIATLVFLLLVFLEWILWIPSSYKKLMIWFYVVLIVYLSVKFIFLPGLRYFGYFRDVTEMDVAEELGKKIPGLQDKLLNYLQLEKLTDYPQSLVERELKRREQQLSVYDFKQIIKFKHYIPFFYLLLIPLFILNIIKISGKTNEFDYSYSRVMAYNKDFPKPAPFKLKILNDLQVRADTSFSMRVAVEGEKVPSELVLLINDKKYKFTRINDTLFAWFFDRVHQSFDFQIKAGRYIFGPYRMTLLKIPVLESYEFEMKYPSYVKFEGDKIYHGTYAKVPYGTRVDLKVKMKYADKVESLARKMSIQKTKDTFHIKFTAKQSSENLLLFSNSKEGLNYLFGFTIEVIPDRKPFIHVRKHTDSSAFGKRDVLLVSAEDDYGLTGLYLYYKTPDASSFNRKKIASARFKQIFNSAYIFPYDFQLPDSVSYRYFFRIYDNNAVDGYQFSDSPVFVFNPMETQKDALKIYEKSLEVLDASYKNSSEYDKNLEKTLQKLKTGKETGWEESNKIKELLKSHREENERMKEMLKEMERLNKQFQQQIQNKETAEQIKKRLEELKKLYEKQELEKEIRRLLEKMQKENLLDKLEELKSRNKFKKRSLERTLELMKRFYVESKLNKMADKLSRLARQQKRLAEKTDPGETTPQKQLQAKTDSLFNEYKKLDSLNKSLKNPVKTPDMKPHFKAASLFQKQAQEKLSTDPAKANQSQQKAANKLSEMAKSLAAGLAQSMEMQEQEDLQQIKSLINNLLQVSFSEEQILQINPDNPHNFTDILLLQNRLNTVMEKTSDTLFAIASRQPAIGSDIFDALDEAMRSGKKSLKHLQEKEFSMSKMRQHIMFQKVNELIYLLNLFLDAKQKASFSIGKGKGKQQSDMQLPDMIKKRSDQIKQSMKKMMERKDGKNKRPGGNKQEGSVYQLYKEQQQLKDLLREFGEKYSGEKVNELNKKLDELSRKLLKQGLTPELYKRFLELHYELLKLTTAAYRQQTEEKRQSRSPEKQFAIPDSIRLQLIRKFFPQTERLQYFNLPLRKDYEELYKRYKTQVK